MTVTLATLALGQELRAWFGLTSERPVHMGVGELWMDNTCTLLLLRLAPGHYVLELLAAATAAAAYLDARRTGALRTHIVAGGGAATAAFLPGAAIFESAVA